MKAEIILITSTLLLMSNFANAQGTWAQEEEAPSAKMTGERWVIWAKACAGDADEDSDKQGLRMPSESDVSGKTSRLQEFAAVAWDAAPWLTFSPSFEHNHSVAEESGVAPEHFLELFFRPHP
jgi:hypothetical protein